MAFYSDTDAQETQEWQEAFDSVLQHMGTERAAFLLEKLYQRAIAVPAGPSRHRLTHAAPKAAAQSTFRFSSRVMRR